MDRRIFVTGIAALGLAGCGRISNPFGRTNPPVARDVVAAETDPRPLIDQVQGVAIEPVTGGVVVRATGLAAVQGHWDPALIGTGEPQGRTLAFRFVAAPSIDPLPAPTPRSREVVAGRFVPADILSRTGQIVVVAARNRATAAH